MKFRFSENLVIDSDAEPFCREGLRIGNFGGPGSGKSFNNALMLEQFLLQGGTVVVFQPRDEYYTLKEKFDVLSVGGVHAKDVVFALTAPMTYAKAVVENGISMIFYTSDVEDEAKLVDWVARFLHAIMRLQEMHHRPLMILPEESQEYLPNSTAGHTTPPWVYNRMIKAFKDCSTQGRKLNIICGVSSQRPQEVNFTIRQLCNVTFYGKFGSHDTKYLDKEVLETERKKGVEIRAEQLTDLGKGEWFVVLDKQSRFVTVTEKRLTKHGADTPSLEYFAPRASAVKQTVDELAKALAAALEKEHAEESDLEKTKRLLRETQKKLEDAEKSGQIKLAVKEMMEGSSVHTSVDASVNTSIDAAKVRQLELELEQVRSGNLLPRVVKQRIDLLEAELEEYRSARKLPKSVHDRLKFLGEVKHDLEEKLKDKDKELTLYADLQSVLRRVLNVQNIYDNIDRVEKKIPTGLPTAGQLPMGLPSSDGAAAVAVTEIRPITLLSEDRPTVKIADSSWEGRILVLAKKHAVFNEPLTRSKIQDALDCVYGERGRPQSVDAALVALVNKRFLERCQDKSNTWVYSLTADAKDRIKEAS